MSIVKSENLVMQIIEVLRGGITGFTLPLVDQIIQEFGGRDPYLILISCLLSLRARDITTIHVCRKLFKIAKTPKEMLSIDRKDLEQIVFKTGFYRTKARVLHEVSQVLINKYNEKVPNTLRELLSIKGIGRKTANLVLGLAYNVPSICVDTHVHRISNRLGLIKTRTVEETEKCLKMVLPKKYWIEWNKLLVIWGQNICVPIRPKCDQCVVFSLCKRRV